VITIATLKDETRKKTRRNKGEKIRYICAVCVDRFNILMAEGSSPESLVGKKFCGTMRQLGRILLEAGIEDEFARGHITQFFEELSGEALPLSLSWQALDERFHPSQRAEDATGELMLYRRLKKLRGIEEDSDDEMG